MQLGLAGFLTLDLCVSFDLRNFIPTSKAFLGDDNAVPAEIVSAIGFDRVEEQPLASASPSRIVTDLLCLAPNTLCKTFIASTLPHEFLLFVVCEADQAMTAEPKLFASKRLLLFRDEVGLGLRT